MASKLRARLAATTARRSTELGLTAGFLCLMLLAVWQVGTVFSNYIDLSEAAREGARAAALSGAPPTPATPPPSTAAQAEGSSPPPTRRSVPGMTSRRRMTVAIARYRGRPARRCAPRSARPTRSASSASSVASGTMSVSDVMRVHRQGA